MRKFIISLIVVCFCLSSYGQRIVILGSSTAAGVGPSPIDSAWVWRFTAYLASNYPAFSVTNLAASGYATADVLPTGDANRNITMALSLNPSAIIVNLPTNDTYNNVPRSTQLANYRTIFNLAKAANVPMWIATPQPRNYLTSTQIQMQKDVKDSIINYYGNYSIDFWTTIAATNGDILTAYWIGDGIHLNNAGHKILFDRVIAKNIPTRILNPSTTYYVSTSGNDSNNGTSTTSPWRTLTKVNSVSFTAGANILFKRGDTWTGDSLVISHSGTSSNPIVYGAYGTGVNPIISGFTTVSTWTNKGGNIWESTNSISTLSNCNMVTINGVNTAMARFPKSTGTNGGYLTATASTPTSATSSTLTGSPNFSGADAVIRIYNWTVDRAKITTQNTSTINFASVGSSFTGNGFFIQNSLNCCTQQNDWYYSPTTKKISIYSTSQPVNVKVASIERTMTIQANYINVNNITFVGANGCGIWGQSSNSGITVNYSKFNQIGLVGIYLNSNALTIANDTLIDINCTAIGLRFGNQISVKDNYLHNIGVLLGMRVETYYVSDYGAIQVEETTNTMIEYNKIINTGQNGISFYGDYMTIRYNYVDSFSTILDDAGGIYTYSGSGRAAMNQARIYNNICTNGFGTQYGVLNRSGASGIYLDEQTKNVESFNNSIANCYLYGIKCNVNYGNISFHHNTVFNGSNYQLFESYSSGAPAPVGDSIYNNILVSKFAGLASEDFQKCLGFWWDDKNAVDGKTVYINSHYLAGNWYARPLADNKVILGNGVSYSLAEWKTFSGKETNSNKSYQNVTTVNDLQFVYNETKVSKTVSLTQAMMDVKGTKYASSIILQPFTSALLMKDYNPGSTAPITPTPRMGMSKGKTVVNKGRRYVSH